MARALSHVDGGDMFHNAGFARVSCLRSCARWFASCHCVCATTCQSPTRWLRWSANVTTRCLTTYAMASEDVQMVEVDEDDENFGTKHEDHEEDNGNECEGDLDPRCVRFCYVCECVGILLNPLSARCLCVCALTTRVLQHEQLSKRGARRRVRWEARQARVRVVLAHVSADC